MVTKCSKDNAYCRQKKRLKRINDNKYGAISGEESESCAQCGKGWYGSYSNEAGEPLLHEWGVEIGEILPSIIGDVVQR